MAVLCPLVGFGTFSVKARAARMGRNPRTGEAIQIKASNVPGFKAGKALKDCRKLARPSGTHSSEKPVVAGFLAFWS